MDNIGSKLREHFTNQGISQVEIANRLGKTKAYVNGVFMGKTKFGKESAATWSKVFGFTRSWLLTGEGPMLISSTDENNQATEKNILPAEKNPQAAEGFILVPMYNLDARGGFGYNEAVDASEYLIDRIPFKDACSMDICIPIVGDSMHPTYRSGTIVLLRKIEQWQEFVELGQVYVIVLTDGRRMIKELRQSQQDKEKFFLCVSHNPQFEPVELPKAMINHIFLVKASYAKTSM